MARNGQNDLNLVLQLYKEIKNVSKTCENWPKEKVKTCQKWSICGQKCPYILCIVLCRHGDYEVGPFEVGTYVSSLTRGLFFTALDILDICEGTNGSRTNAQNSFDEEFPQAKMEGIILGVVYHRQKWTLK